MENKETVSEQLIGKKRSREETENVIPDAKRIKLNNSDEKSNMKESKSNVEQKQKEVKTKTIIERKQKEVKTKSVIERTQKKVEINHEEIINFMTTCL